MVPTGNFVGSNLEHDPLRNARGGPGGDGCRNGRLTGETHRFFHGVGIFDYFALPTNHDSPEVGVAFADLDHDADLRVTPEVDHLLGLAVRGHVDHAIFVAIPHRDDVREAFF